MQWGCSADRCWSLQDAPLPLSPPKSATSSNCKCDWGNGFNLRYLGINVCIQKVLVKLSFLLSLSYLYPIDLWLITILGGVVVDAIFVVQGELNWKPDRRLLRDRRCDITSFSCARLSSVNRTDKPIELKSQYFLLVIPTQGNQHFSIESPCRCLAQQTNCLQPQNQHHVAIELLDAGLQFSQIPWFIRHRARSSGRRVCCCYKKTVEATFVAAVVDASDDRFRENI